jgi:hypothetical protein
MPAFSNPLALGEAVKSRGGPSNTNVSFSSWRQDLVSFVARSEFETLRA